MHDEEAAAAEKRIKELEGEIGVIAGGRDEIIAVLPGNVMKRYGKIRAKIGTGVAAVIGGICQACRVRIPPQQYNDMQRANSIENCPHCLRYIYVPSVLGLHDDNEADEARSRS